jgi:hypothetical protein
VHALLRLQLQPQAGWLSTVAIVTVCFEWFSIFARRRQNRQQIRRHFKRMVANCLKIICLYSNLTRQC